jgi:hypothetical protein
VLEGLVDTATAARYLGLSRSTLEKARVYGGGPKYYKYSKVIRYRPEDLDAWLSERLMHTTSAKATEL